MPTRRQTLAIIGGGAIAAASGLGVHLTRMPEAAMAPWSAAGQYDDPRKRALSWAILAPNPHNRQPWIVDLDQPGQATLFVDTNRLLPHTDPFSRQIVIGLGCFLEVCRMAALEDGYTVTFDLFPDGSDGEALDARPVAVMRFDESDEARDPLFAHIPMRRSLKEPYDLSRPVPDDALPALLASGIAGPSLGASNDPNHVQALRDLTEEALRIEIATPRTYRESVDLFRIGRREVNADPDGIDFSGPLFEAGNTFGFFSREAALDRSSNAFQQGLAAVLENTTTAMAHIWMVTEGNTREDQIAAGRDWVRVNLVATALGLGFQPLSQALQEYPEMAGLYADVHNRLAPGGGTVQMLARLGYGPDVPVSPRWPLEAKLRDAKA